MLLHHRNIGLDVIRSTAILLVVLTHSQRILRMAFPRLLFHFPIDGVTLFFVLSGFLIGRIVFKTLPQGEWKELASFYKRRWWRTLPNYYLFLFLQIIAYVLMGVRDQIDWHSFAFLQNLVAPNGSFFKESWSLAVEEWFYLVFPLIWWIWVRYLPKGQRPSFLIYSVLFLVVAWIYKYSFFSQSVIEDAEVFSRIPVVFRISSILWGVVLGAIQLLWPHYFKRPWFWLALLIISWISWKYSANFISSYWRSVWVFDFKSLLSFSLIALLFQLKSLNKHISIWVTKLSLFSYSMYLINLPFLAILRWALVKIGAESPILILSALILGWIGIFKLSEFNYTKFEKRMTRLRD